VRLLLIVEHRFVVGPDSNVWTTTGFSPSFWRRSLQAFDEIHVAGRAAYLREVPASARPVDHPAIKLAAIPMFNGLTSLLSQYRRVRSALADAISGCDVALLQVPGALANLAYPLLLQRHIAYGVNAVGDPEEVFNSGVGARVLRPLSRHWFVSGMRRQCEHAAVAVYVTRSILQQRYPPGPSTFVASCSNVDLPDEAFGSASERFRAEPPFHIVTVVSLEQRYKGVDVLIRALRHIKERGGQSCELDIIGDGRLRPELESLTREGGLTDIVHFLGPLPNPAAVRAVTTGYDLFVLASRTEGLPRALVEAMAIGLPCVGTSVGGIPELLEPEDCVPPDNVTALGDLINVVLGDPLRRHAMAERNIRKARNFHQNRLEARRRAAYRALAERASSAQTSPSA
jgi:glycosyltransferase involved in cell wall biosynthesis